MPLSYPHHFSIIKCTVKATKYTLLIVDDDQNQRLLFARTFERLGTKYRLQLASNGHEAIAYLKGEGKFGDRSKFEFPSYILTDLQMSPGDGFHLLEFIKQNPAMSIIPVVMLSTSDDEDDIRQAYLLGASSYFVKPNTLPELESLLNDIHHYWTRCEVPLVDADGYATETQSRGRLGARYGKPERAQNTVTSPRASLPPPPAP